MTPPVDLGGPTTALEQIPRLDVADLKALPYWPELRARSGGTLLVDTQHGAVHVDFRLTTDVTSLGRRYWFECGCGQRRKHLYLRAAELRCRRCHRLLYGVQLLPDTRWRRDVARPLLRAVRTGRKRTTAERRRDGR